MRTSATEKSGFTFLGCKLTGSGSTYLGRPWGAYSRVVFAYSFFSNVVAPQGWNQWGDSTKQNTVYYGEYKCYGPGADRGQRVKWSKQLSDDEATGDQNGAELVTWWRARLLGHGGALASSSSSSSSSSSLLGTALSLLVTQTWNFPLGLVLVDLFGVLAFSS
ncbi:putative pectinesterase 11 [Capsella rubella]|uniref:putative pectinesterase 11 n=1 Tax=Capsella rubella TaxID=81985 RepID=UPI000CD4C669|nr:putative pectinesterase 11 [Capsella rubella]